VSETEGVQYNAPAYQEDECCEEDVRRRAVSDITSDMPLNRVDEQGPIFDAAEIANLRKEKNIELQESDGEDVEDDTILEYCDEGEGGAINEVDSDDE